MFGAQMFHVKRGTPAALGFLDEALARAKERGLLRERATPAHGCPLSFCSNDYLGLADQFAPRGEAGAGASRLVGGDRPVHARLEGAAAELVGEAAALVFTSGYAANVGAISALAGPGDLVVSDALNHASIIDGARLSRARVEVVPHLDLGAVEAALRARTEGRAFVVTESYFSMDADSPDLRALRGLCDAFGAALVVDEAHALGALGPDGTGLCRAAGVTPDVLLGTLGKSFGAAGGFATGCAALTGWLWNRARSFVYSTGISPMVARAASEGLAASRATPALRQRLDENVSAFRRGLAGGKLRLLGYGHVVPWVIGDAGVAVAVSRELEARGLRVPAIRPPTVPVGAARLRFSLSAAHTGEEIARAVGLVRDVACRHL